MLRGSRIGRSARRWIQKWDLDGITCITSRTNIYLPPDEDEDPAFKTLHASQLLLLAVFNAH